MKTIIVDLRWSKTRQKMGKVLQLPLLPLVAKDICPIHWLKRMVRAVPGDSTSPLFLTTPVKGKGYVPLTYGRLGEQLKDWADKVLGTKEGWTLHCLRQGGVTWCFNVDITTEAIRLMGDWASDAYKNYLDMDLYKRAESMQKFKAGIDKLFFETKH